MTVIGGQAKQAKKVQEKAMNKLEEAEEEEEAIITPIIINKRKNRIIRHSKMITNQILKDQIGEGSKVKTIEEIEGNNKKKYKKRNPLINKKKFLEKIFK
jgi:hypothetical protein